MENTLLLKNGRILDEDGNLIKQDILIEGGLIKELGENIIAPLSRSYDLNGMLVSPGFIDVHVHLREPGFTHKETLLSGSNAALKGGYTTIFAMPNVIPVPDDGEKMKNMYGLASKCPIKVNFYSPLTMGEDGEELVDFKELKEASAIGFTDDGKGLQSAKMMREAMIMGAKEGFVVAAHCEENSLINGGYIHEGKYSKDKGHRGIPGSCEDVQISRDILLAAETSCKYHICHMSTRRGVDLLELGQKWGARVSGEVTPHHLILCEDDLKEDGNYKMNPPLRSKEDREGLIEGLKRGVISVIGTDHAPHSVEEKSRGLEKSPFGIIGTEDAFALLYTELVLKNKLTLKTIIDGLTKGPREVFDLKEGSLDVGSPADITVIDLEEEYIIDGDAFESLSKNSPFIGRKVKGRAKMVLVNGEIRLMGGKKIG